MNRWLGASLTAALLAVLSGWSAYNGRVFGADPSLPKNERRLLLRHEEASRKKLAEKLRLERAQRIARARLSNAGYGSRPAPTWVPFAYPTSISAPPPPRPFYWYGR